MFQKTLTLGTDGQTDRWTDRRMEGKTKFPAALRDKWETTKQPLQLCTMHRYTVILVFFNTVRTGIFHNRLYGSAYGFMWKHKENLRIL